MVRTNKPTQTANVTKSFFPFFFHDAAWTILENLFSVPLTGQHGSTKEIKNDDNDKKQKVESEFQIKSKQQDGNILDLLVVLLHEGLRVNYSFSQGRRGEQADDGMTGNKSRERKTF